MKKLLIGLLLISCTYSFASISLVISKSEKTVTFVSHIYFYGAGDESSASQCLIQIKDNWEGANYQHHVNIKKNNLGLSDGNYLIKFDITGEHVDTKKKLRRIKRENKHSSKVSYWEIKQYPQINGNKIVSGGAKHFGITNEFFVSYEAIWSPFKVCPHEYGHLIGIHELNSDEPSMMTQSTFATKLPQYMIQTPIVGYNRFQVGNFDPRLREVKEKDINELKILIQGILMHQQFSGSPETAQVEIIP